MVHNIFGLRVALDENYLKEAESNPLRWRIRGLLDWLHVGNNVGRPATKKSLIATEDA